MLFPGCLGSDIAARPAANRTWSSEVIRAGSPCVWNDVHCHVAREVLRLHGSPREAGQRGKKIRFIISELQHGRAGRLQQEVEG